MGFLSGAYGKLMAGKLVRDLQYQMTSVQSRLRRVTREIGDMEKNMQAQERNLKAQMQNQMQASIFGAMSEAGVGGFDQTNMLGVVGGMSSEQYSLYAMIQQQVQQQYSMAQSMWQNMFEMQREAQLQPLKDLEDSLQTEKDNLESRLKIAQAEYDAKKEEEEAGVKGLTPDYTGQG